LAGVLQNGGASMREIAKWGKRKMAYEISKKAEGYYVIYYFTLDGSEEVLATFERTCRYDEQVMRQMVVKVPTRKRGLEVPQLVPSPGWLADFKLESRAHMRRRFDRGGEQFQPAAPAAAPAEAEAPAEAPAEEEKPEA
jgi:small subunit ribosomal protein S6